MKYDALPEGIPLPIYETKSHIRNLSASWLRIPNSFGYLKTVLEPTLNELALLGGIVVLRTILSVFLNKEIKELESEENKKERQTGLEPATLSLGS